ncbi:hypothetical protein [Hanstruepera marina]|uniref:hypothetical protein n=1 Tax=Hanstruepera marina TaxID=2873265 RepID=UPI001CA690ED|nr:hypothetical protein [Hanstruepera marina]
MKSIPKGRLIIAVIIGIASALTIYSFFYVLREVFRVMATSLDNEPNILSEENREYYNLFFASLSVVFGNSIAFNFVFSRPQKVTHRFNSKRKRLLNDNIFLSFNFSYWFAKIGLSFGVFSMCCMEYEFLPYFKEVSFLLILVLYLESLKSFNFLLKNITRLKFIGLHVIFLLFISLGLGKINIVNYKGLDKAMLKNNPIMELPYSSYYSEQKNFRFNSVTIKLDEDSLGILHFYSNKKKYTFDDIPDFITRERSNIREEMIPFFTISIEANKSLNIHNLKRLEQILLNIDQRLISYKVSTDEALENRFEEKEISKRLNKGFLKISDAKSLLPPSFFDSDSLDATKSRLRDSVLISVGKQIYWNNKFVNKDDLIKEFKTHQSKETIFIYQFEDKATYQNYITVLSSHFNAINQLRKANQTIFKKYEYENPEGYSDEQRRLKDKFPIIILEVVK